MKRWSGLLTLACVFPAEAWSQDSAQAPGPSRSVGLTLAEALHQARANSPMYRQALNDAGAGQVGSTECLWQPTSLGDSLKRSRLYRFRAVQLRGWIYPADIRVSHLGLQPGARVAAQRPARFKRPASRRALQRATDEDIGAASVGLTAEISTQYLSTLQAGAQVAVARQQVSRNEDFLALARARHRVGQATLLDVRQAEVTKGTSDVALLRAVQAENEAKLDLLRRMGVESPVAIDQIVLTDSFPVTPPDFRLDSLLALSERQNPGLRSLRARGHAAELDVRAAKTDFLPTLSLRAGWRGFTQQFTNENLLLGQALSERQVRPPTASSTTRSAPAFRWAARPAIASPRRGWSTAEERSWIRSPSRSAIRTVSFPSRTPASLPAPT